jgi:hypothetical protein
MFPLVYALSWEIDAKAIYITSLHVKKSRFVESILFEPGDSSLNLKACGLNC